MTLQELESKYLKMWPQIVNISDGVSQSNGYYFRELSKIHSDIEDQIDHENDHWGNIYTLAMFQASHYHAENLLKMGKLEIEIQLVQREIVDKYIRQNLNGNGGWEQENDQYIGIGL